MIKAVFNKLNVLDYTIKYNHRGILSGLATLIGAEGKESEMCVAIDKLDKVGFDIVKEELTLNGFSEQAIALLFELLSQSLTLTGFASWLMKKGFDIPDELSTGINDLNELLKLSSVLNGEMTSLKFDLSLARGLSYYTGPIFEVKISNLDLGSVSGGGRYDNLTGAFGWKGIPGVGFSFGVDRLYDALTELGLFPSSVQKTTQVLVSNFDEELTQPASLKLLVELREAGFIAEIYPEPSKLKKQLSYANAKGIPIVVLIGEEEFEAGLCTIKEMTSGNQNRTYLNDAVSMIEDLLASEQ
jgi:histidyl-tRNA synthetase